MNTVFKFIRKIQLMNIGSLLLMFFIIFILQIHGMNFWRGTLGGNSIIVPWVQPVLDASLLWICYNRQKTGRAGTLLFYLFSALLILGPSHLYYSNFIEARELVISNEHKISFLENKLSGTRERIRNLDQTLSTANKYSITNIRNRLSELRNEETSYSNDIEKLINTQDIPNYRKTILSSILGVLLIVSLATLQVHIASVLAGNQSIHPSSTRDVQQRPDRETMLITVQKIIASSGQSQRKIANLAGIQAKDISLAMNHHRLISKKSETISEPKLLKLYDYLSDAHAT